MVGNISKEKEPLGSSKETKTKIKAASEVKNNATNPTPVSTVASEDRAEVQKTPLSEIDKESGAARGRAERRRVIEVKKKIFELEQKNDRYILIFRSTNEWWKIGGNSALYYKYIVGPRIKKKINLIKDDDHYSTFRTGVASIRDLESFEYNMMKAGLSRIKGNENAIQYEFEQPIEPSTIQSIKKHLEVRTERVNRLVETTTIVPRLHVKIREMLRDVWYYAKNHQKGLARGWICNDLLSDARKMKKIYSRLANGLMDVERGLKEIMVLSNDMLSDIAFLEEVQEIGFDRCCDIQDKLAEIKHTAKAEIKKMKREQEKQKKLEEKTAEKNG